MKIHILIILLTLAVIIITFLLYRLHTLKNCCAKILDQSMQSARELGQTDERFHYFREKFERFLKRLVGNQAVHEYRKFLTGSVSVHGCGGKGWSHEEDVAYVISMPTSEFFSKKPDGFYFCKSVLRTEGILLMEVREGWIVTCLVCQGDDTWFTLHYYDGFHKNLWQLMALH